MNRQRHKQHPEVLILMLGVAVFAAMVILSQFEVQERFFGNHHQKPYESAEVEHHVTTGIYTSRDGVVHDGHAEARERARNGGSYSSAPSLDLAGSPDASPAASNAADASVHATADASGNANPSANANPFGNTNPSGNANPSANATANQDDYRPPVKSAREVYLELRTQEESKRAEAMSKQAEATAMSLKVETAKVAAEKEAALRAAAAKEAALKDLADKEALLKAQAAKDAALGEAANRRNLLATASGAARAPAGSSANPAADSSTPSAGSSPSADSSAPPLAGSATPPGASMRNTLPGSRFVSMAQSRGVNVPLAEDAVSSTVTRFYGATFIADPKLKLPAKAMFEKPADSRAYQKTIPLKRFYMGGYRVSLQTAAADALIAAQKEANATKLKITPVGDVASLRSYEDTSFIWHKYLEKGLSYWVTRKKITPVQARSILASPPKKQLSQVIAMEQKGLYLHANHAHSILNLAAPPGSSQHISGLALDIEEHQNANVRAILNRHGWYQTVAHDFPHFIYLGRPVGELPQLGLTSIKSDGRQFWVPDVPDNLPPALH